MKGAINRKRAVIVIAVLAVPGLILLQNQLAGSAVERELQLAWSEGIPTNGAQLASLIPAATEAENAAPFYAKIRGRINYRELNSPSPSYELTFKPTQASIHRAKLTLEQYHDVLELADQATLRPKCWFNRDWSDFGNVNHYQDSSNMLALARLLRIRGSLAARLGDVASALKYARQIRTLAGHAEVVFSASLREHIYAIYARQLANWAFAYRDKAYRDELAKALDGFPAFDWKAEHRGDLYRLLYWVEIEKSEKEMRKAGMKDDDMPTVGDKLPALVIGKTRALLILIQAERAKWKALDMPPRARDKALADVYSKQDIPSLAYPLVHRQLNSSYLGQVSDDEQEWNLKAKLHEYRVLLRVLSLPVIPRSFSPGVSFDGTPLTYAFDGRQIVISVKKGIYGLSEELKMPEDPPPTPRNP